jgi:uncharacterized protein (DUF1800 family)
MNHSEPKLAVEVEADANCATSDATSPAHTPASLITPTVSHRRSLIGLLSLPLVACGGGGGEGASGGSSQQAGGSPSPAPAPVSPAEASRFLGLASFGATEASIAEVVKLGYAGWVEQQLTSPLTTHASHVDPLMVQSPSKKPWEFARNLLDSFYMKAIQGPDQVRQRVTFALSQIFVVSMASNEVVDRSRCHVYFVDMLQRNAFGNFRTLLEEVATHGMMGVYLSHRGNKKEDLVTGTMPDENFAREIMQLFSIGLVKLNPDGTPQRDNVGNTIPTYGNADVMGLARVFTGWSWVPIDGNDYRFRENFPDSDIQIQPMVPYEKYHSTSEKSFLGVTVPKDTTALPSLKIALDTLFNHPNTGPFIGRQLIQRLVTSNPSPAYVSRVAAAFANNGAGVRGDMKALIRAVLLDDEARLPAKAGDGRHGKVREPVLRLTAWARAFGATSDSGEFRIRQTNNIGQTPLSAPSVFNFYRPGFVPPGSAIGAQKLVAPELQINTESQVTSYLNFMSDVVEKGTGDNRDVKCSYTAEMALAATPDALIDRVGLLLTGQRLSPATRASIRTAIDSVAITASNAAATRTRIAVMLAVCSPEFLVQI